MGFFVRGSVELFLLAEDLGTKDCERPSWSEPYPDLRPSGWLWCKVGVTGREDWRRGPSRPSMLLLRPWEAALEEERGEMRGCRNDEP